MPNKWRRVSSILDPIPSTFRLFSSLGTGKKNPVQRHLKLFRDGTFSITNSTLPHSNFTISHDGVIQQSGRRFFFGDSGCGLVFEATTWTEDYPASIISFKYYKTERVQCGSSSPAWWIALNHRTIELQREKSS
jgi:hypothetical protein